MRLPIAHETTTHVCEPQWTSHVLAAPPSFSPIIDGQKVFNILMSIAKVLQAINFKFTEHTKESLGYPQLFVPWS